MLQLTLNFRDELLTPAVNVVLRVEERPAPGVALGLQGLDLLLPRQLSLKRQSSGSCAPGLLDLAVQLLTSRLRRSCWPVLTTTGSRPENPHARPPRGSSSTRPSRPSSRRVPQSVSDRGSPTTRWSGPATGSRSSPRRFARSRPASPGSRKLEPGEAPHPASGEEGTAQRADRRGRSKEGRAHVSVAECGRPSRRFPP